VGVVSLLLDSLKRIPDFIVSELLATIQKANQNRGFKEPIGQEFVERFRTIFTDINRRLADDHLEQLPLDDEGIQGEVSSYTINVLEQRI
jgi:hypothetical protein